MITDNPAYRLHAILSEALRVGKPHAIRETWAQVFGTTADDLATIFKKLGQLNELIEESEHLVNQLDHVNHSLYLRHFPNLRQAVSPSNMDASWNHTVNFLDGATMQGLEFCAFELSKQHVEHAISNEVLTRLLEEADSLLSSVLEAEIDEKLKVVLIDALSLFRQSLLEYKMRGVAGIKRALIYFAGAATLNQKLFDQEKTRPSAKAIFEGIGAFVSAVSEAVTTATKAWELTEAIRHLALPPGNG